MGATRLPLLTLHRLLLAWRLPQYDRYRRCHSPE